MWNLENGIDELTCKAEIVTQTCSTNVWTPRGREAQGGWVGVGIHTLKILCMK